MISVCIPVGPYEWYKTFLRETLESVAAQTLPPNDVVLVDDMANIDVEDLELLLRPTDEIVEDLSAKFALRVVRDERDFIRVWRAPWRLGIPGCANVGIALGQTNLVFQLSCDDRLLPDCLAECWAEWKKQKDPLGYYWVGVEYSTGETQSLACGHALVPKTLWEHTGGFPPETGIGGCDAAFISMMIMKAGDAGKLYKVAGGRPLYWHREHELQYTKNQNAHPESIVDVRDVFGKRWQPMSANPWGRLES